MNILHLGGTGNISSSCHLPALEHGMKVYVVNRGNHSGRLPEGVRFLKGDVNQPGDMESILSKHRFDVVVDWIAYKPEDVERDIRWFEGKVGQYIFISSASAYHKPVRNFPIVESTPLHNPHWEYSRKKIECEKILMQAYCERGFPATIVRPSHTYCERNLPLPFPPANIVLERLLNGLEIVVPGDGTSLWTLTHSTDFAKGFVGLLGQDKAIGEAYHITSDEWLTWDQIVYGAAQYLNVKAKIVHIPSDELIRIRPQLEGPLLGDKAHSVIFDNSKIKRLVPSFICTMPFFQGIKYSLDHFLQNRDQNPVDSSQSIHEELLAGWNKR